MKFLLNSLFVILLTQALAVAATVDPLPSWSDVPLKSKIVEFVKSVSDPDSPSFVPWKHRIAALDLDGTLMAEWPINFQRAIAVERLKEHVRCSPSLGQIQPFKAACEDDSDFYNHKQNHSWVFLTAWEQQSKEEYREYVKDFLDTHKAAHWGVTYEDLFYKPALELVQLLRDHDFQVFICSTTEVECIRVLVKKVLDFNPVFVIGNEVESTVLEREGNISFVMGNQFRSPENRSDQKSIYFNYRTGRRPIFGFGNSYGDASMLKLAQSSGHPSFVMVLDHDDAERELDYHDGALLNDAKRYNWHVISMKNHFKQVFAENVKPVEGNLDIHRYIK